MQVASEIILELSIEQQRSGPPWPHPWDHYPFQASGKHVWLRYLDLDSGQREQVRRAMAQVKGRIEQINGVRLD